MELNKKVRVNILHVESPHKFYFRKYSDAVDIDSKIKGYVDAYGVSSSGAIPSKGDIVIVKIDNRFRIVRVCSQSACNQYLNVIIIENFIELKDQPLLKLETQSIYIGSICGVVPAEEVSQYKRKTKMKYA